jgi:hypothetical protein
MRPSRRGFLVGLGAVIAAPAIVRASSLMPVKAPRKLIIIHNYMENALIVPAPPEGWIACYGQRLSRARYAKLFQAIGNTYGGDDAAATFNLPDLRGQSCGLAPEATGPLRPTRSIEHIYAGGGGNGRDCLPAGTLTMFAGA